MSRMEKHRKTAPRGEDGMTATIVTAGEKGRES
jgi:hypothetical protein